MAQYQGVITGIGDFDANINKIQPQFDAAYRNWVAGGNGILSGLKIFPRYRQEQKTFSINTDPKSFWNNGLNANIAVAWNNVTQVTVTNNDGAARAIIIECYFEKTSTRESFTLQAHANKSFRLNILSESAQDNGVLYIMQITDPATNNSQIKTGELGQSNSSQDTVYLNFPITGRRYGSLTVSDSNVQNVVANQGNATNFTATYDGRSQIEWQQICSFQIETYDFYMGSATYSPSSVYSSFSYTIDVVESSSLTAGYCMAQGYVGNITQDIDISSAEYVYGVFKVYHDENKVDEFYIETSDLAIDTQDDILNEAGTYYLLLCEGQVLNSDLVPYPYKTYNSDIATELSANGTIDSNAVCTTQPVDDNSQRVASTEFVQKQIEKDINAGTGEVTIYHDSEVAYILHFIRKAHLVCVTREQRNNDWGTWQTYKPFSLPSGFEPNNDLIICLRNKGYRSSSDFDYVEQWQIKAGSTSATLIDDSHGDIAETGKTFYYTTNN